MKSDREKIKTVFQGTIRVDKVVSRPNYTEFIVMFPDGEIVPFGVSSQFFEDELNELCKSWFKRHCPKDAIGVGKIVWSWCPERREILAVDEQTPTFEPRNEKMPFEGRVDLTRITKIQPSHEKEKL